MLIISTIAFSDEYGKVCGIVKCGPTDGPLIAVNVYLKNTHIGSATDDNGNYCISKIPPGKYEIIVEMIGFSQHQRKFIDVKEGENLELDFVLQPQTINYDNGVTITATRGHSLITEVPSSVNVVDQQELELKNPQNLAEALQNVPGVTIKDYGGLGNQKSISLRGSSSEQVLVMLDGQRLNNPQTGQVDFSTISVEGIERIEVVRGGNAALYGADAVGGVINIITKKADQDINGVSGSIKLTGASFRTNAIEPAIQYKKGKASISGSAKYLESEGDFPYTDNYGNEQTRLNADIISRDYYICYNQYLGDPHYQRNISLSWKHFNSEKGAPGSIEPYYYHARMWDKNNQLNLIWSGKIINLFNDLRIQTFYNDSWNRYKNDKNEAVQNVDSKYITQTWGSEVQLKSVLGPQVSFTYGGGFRSDWMKNKQNNETNKRDSYYLLLVNESLICVNNIVNTVSFVPSIRYDYNSDFTNKISPKVGTVFNFGNTWQSTLKWNIGQSYRAPTFNDLYWPEDAWTKGNPDLKPEYGWDWDVGVRLQYPLFNGIYFESGYFENRMTQLILWQEEAGFWMPQNVGKSRFKGVENSLRLQPVQDFLSVNANYTFLDARNLSDERTEFNKILIYRPKHTVNVNMTIEYRFITLSYQYNYTSRRYTDASNIWANSLEPYSTSDISLVIQPTFKKLDYSFSFQIKNLFNEEYRVVKNMPVPGREYRFSVKISI